MSAAPLRVLIAHNAYQQWGGEDSVVEAESALLTAHGHVVERYIRHNNDVGQLSLPQLALQTLWSPRTLADLADLKARFRPDVIHVHNTLPLLSPAVFWAAHRIGVPVVQTLHNFRWACPQAMFVREGKVCEDCLGRVPWRGVMHACYRGSRAQTAVVAATLTLHKALGTPHKKVDRFIALNEFCRSKMIEAGLPADRIVIKPNFVDAPQQPQWTERVQGLYLGRLTAEKGVGHLMSAWPEVGAAQPLKVVGGGDLEARVRATAGVDYLGFKSAAEVAGILAGVAYMVVPSVWYEGFPRTIVEAYAAGVPVVASRIGSLAEVVVDGETGLLFNPGDEADLAAKLRWAESHPAEMVVMGRKARQLYEQRYSPDQNLRQLLDIYRDAKLDFENRRFS